MTTVSQLQELDITPGVMPDTDATAYDIPCLTEALHIRADPSTGRIRKLGGWLSNTFNYGNTVSGTIRTIYSATINQKVYTILGTNQNVYSLIGSSLENITPLQASFVAVPNSLSTHYDTLGSNPVTTTSGSSTVVVTDANASSYKINDSYTLSGASGFNGISSGLLNATHVIRSIAGNLVTIILGGSATATGSGGGASVVRSSGLITLTSIAHGLSNGERVKVSGATDTGGILAAQINQEFIIRNVTANTFDFMTSGTTTSSVSGAGGASTVYYPQLAAGSLNAGSGQGYGMGLYGVGLYGTALTSTSAQTYPRIWFIDRFGEKLTMNPGASSPVYIYDPTTDASPTVIPGAPTDVNYAFVSNNILVTFGHDQENQIFASDQGDYTQWVASSTNQVFQDNVEGAGRLMSHCPTDTGNLIFTQNQTYTFNYIGQPLIWSIGQLDANIGIIAPMARVSVNGIAYWMGQENFYLYRGGKVETIPSNFGPQSSILRYVFDNLNYNQRSKCFAGYCAKYDEIWFHYPSANSNECDRVARYSRKLNTWVPDTLDRTAWEWPVTSLSNPRLANMSTLYTHEAGTDADGLPMEWRAVTRKVLYDTKTANMANIIPDSTMSGTISVILTMYNYPQSLTPMAEKTYAVTAITEKVPSQANGRLWQLGFSGNELGQDFLMGQWMVEPQPGARAP